MKGQSMSFSGANLLRLRDSLDLALSDLHNSIATCPDVNLYAEDIEEYKTEKAKVGQLLARVNKKLNTGSI